MSCMATVKRYTYPFDPTGRQESNLIQKEYHTITAANRTPQNVLIPGYAPFFRQSLVVTDLATGQPLLEGIDYTCEWPVISASENSATEAYTPIYGGIQFIDNNITGRFSLKYQTIGGQYALDGIEIAQALANQANDPLVTKYEDIIGKPLTFPPLEHVHSIEDFVGFEDLCLAVIQLKEAIELLAREDRDTHPGYDTLVDAFFRLEDKLKQHQQLVNDLSQEFKDTVLQIRQDVNSLIDAFKTDVNNRLNRMKDQLETALKNLDNKLSALIDALRNTIDNELKPDIAALKSRLDGNEFVKTGNVNQTIDGSKTFKKMLHIEDGRLNLRKVGESTFSAGIGIVTESGSGNKKIEKVVIKNDVITNTGNTEAYSLEFNETFIKHQGRQLAYQDELTLLSGGLDKFIAGTRTANTTAGVTKLNRYIDDPELANGFLNGTVVPNNAAHKAILGEFPLLGYGTNTTVDYVGLNLVDKGGNGQVTQFLSFGPNIHYLRTKESAGDSWVNEMLVTSGNIGKVINPDVLTNIVYTSDTNQEIDGIKTFKQPLRVNNITDANKPNKYLEIGEYKDSVYVQNTLTKKSLDLKDEDYITYGGNRIPTFISSTYLGLGGIHTSNAGIHIQRFADNAWKQREQDWYIVAEAYNTLNASGVSTTGNRLRFSRNAYTKHADSEVNASDRSRAEFNSAINISLPNSGGEVVVTGANNHFRVSGESWYELLKADKLAPLMFTKASEINDTKPFKIGTAYYPIMKALYRVNNVMNKAGNEQVAGWSYGIYKGTNAGTKSSFILHYVDDSEGNPSNNTDREDNNYFSFQGYGSATFASSLGKYSIYRYTHDAGTENGLVISNNIAGNRWVKIKDNGDVAIGADNQIVPKFDGEYLRVDTKLTASDAAAYAGFEVKVNTIPYCFEVDTLKRFKLTRIATNNVNGVNYPQVEHLFQDKSGTVAHLSDLDPFIKGASVDNNTVTNYLTKSFADAKNGFFKGGMAPSNAGVGTFPLITNLTASYDFTGITMTHGGQVTHLISLGVGRNYFTINDDSNWSTSLILESNNMGSFLDTHTGGSNNIDHGIVTYKDKDQSINGTKTFTKLTNFDAGIKLSKQKSLTGSASRVSYDGKTLAFETDVSAVNTKVTTLSDNVKGITVSGGLKYNNNKVLLQSDYDALKKLIDGKQAAGSYASASEFNTVKTTVNGLSNAYVSLTATQSVGGTKTFSESTNFTKGISVGANKLTITQANQDNRNVLNMAYVKVTDIYVSSDKNLKENIQPIENALDKVVKLNGRTFDWKTSGRHTAGFIAQEVEKVIPDMVTTDNKGLKAVNYVDTIAYLVEAIKEQQKQIEVLQAKLN